MGYLAILVILSVLGAILSTPIRRDIETIQADLDSIRGGFNSIENLVNVTSNDSPQLRVAGVSAMNIAILYLWVTANKEYMHSRLSISWHKA